MCVVFGSFVYDFLSLLLRRKVLDEDEEIPQELLIEKQQLEELLGEAQKLKSWKRIHKVSLYFLRIKFLQQNCFCNVFFSSHLFCAESRCQEV